MIITSSMQKSLYSGYSNKNMKLSRDIKNGNLIKIKNGLYETNPNIPAYYLSGVIYGPSYISFDFALSYYGLIPERVETVTCATFNKKKKKIYKTPFGKLIYRDVPSNIYPYGINLVEENGYSYQIAIKEKALCDKLYTLSPVNNIDEMNTLLFNDLRIDEEEFWKMNINIIKELSELYHSTNVLFLYKYMRRRKSE